MLGYGSGGRPDGTILLCAAQHKIVYNQYYQKFREIANLAIFCKDPFYEKFVKFKYFYYYYFDGKIQIFLQCEKVIMISHNYFLFGDHFGCFENHFDEFYHSNTDNTATAL